MATAVLEEPKTATKHTLQMPLARLQQALATVTLAVERKTTIPVLASVKVEEQDGFVDFSATTLDLAARYRVILPDSKQRAPFLMPGLKLESFARLLEGDTVKITNYDDKRATLVCGRSTTRLPLQSTASYPAIQFPDDYAGVSLPREVLERLLDFTSFAISKEESRYTLNGALLEIENGRLSLIATDGHRLARYSLATDKPNTSTLLPLTFLKAIDKAIGCGAETLLLSSDDVNVYAGMDGDGFAVALSHRKLTGQFPNYRAVMPSETAVTITVDAELMTHALRRCGMFTDERSGALVVTFTPDLIRLRGANAETGESEEVIDANVVGLRRPTEADESGVAQFHTGFNTGYLLDAFSRLKGDVELRFAEASGQKPMLLVAHPEEGETFEYVVMPMRV